jgi:hypothetical protein
MDPLGAFRGSGYDSPPMKRLSVALILLGAASGRLSAQVSVVLPEFGTVRAGETATIEWRGLPEGVEELELLLTVEGRDLPIRLTPQLAAPAKLVSWSVPNLPSSRARLTVRFGLAGEEIESAPSAPFEILPAENGPPAVLTFREGEWWVQESSGDSLAGSLGAAPDGDRVQEDREAPPCAGSSPSIWTERGPSARASRLQALPAASARARLFLASRPIAIPARL